MTNATRVPSAARLSAKLSILLVDANSERRALRRKIMALHGVDVVGATDITEATSIWHRDRYDMVLIDIRRDYRGSVAWRDEIKKEKPQQVVAFLVGGPRYVDLDPLADSYVAEIHGSQWGDALRQAVRKSCESLPQRNSFAEAGWRITAARKISGTSDTFATLPRPTELEPNALGDLIKDTDEPSPASPDAQLLSAAGTDELSMLAPPPITNMESE
jgi:CheY-like chemotaxis protein